MNPHYTYLMVDIGCLAVPLLFSFHPRLNFYKEWKHFIGPCLATAAFFLGWDALYTKLGVWAFNPDYVVGAFLLGMPVEEYLFFICIPFACLFSYHAFTVLIRFGTLYGIHWFYLALAVGLLIAGIYNMHRLYTGATFIMLSLALFYCIRKKVRFFPAFLASFLFVLIPFLLSNGILTGSFFDRVVVSYNNEENLGIRLLTIPVEDIFYAMLLLLMNVYGFEIMKQRAQYKQVTHSSNSLS